MAGHTAKAEHREASMSEKREQLEIVKLELEIENLKKDLVYKDFKIKAIAWGLFFSGLTLLAKLKGGGA
ncbi:hypothetical protein [Endozoicomonas sp. SCSIO W0465]|uniref:hypothetical protein n=1 Tax=Endozoicomonas sp. SCSIO W0465 TaxID=2918516 RepID=UPI00207639D8|nr:hypothetical protein [Endozoicomonas sp. SCSIO W0465]USE39236.1 hypothetical protein MJO57_14385 [Endozoicomonas sp. SCSIO W0465]